jgi:hypothetical protein
MRCSQQPPVTEGHGGTACPPLSLCDLITSWARRRRGTPRPCTSRAPTSRPSATRRPIPSIRAGSSRRMARREPLRPTGRGPGRRRHRAHPRHLPPPRPHPLRSITPPPLHAFPRCFQVATIVCHSKCRQDKSDCACRSGCTTRSRPRGSTWFHDCVFGVGAAAKRRRLQCASRSAARHEAAEPRPVRRA